ncbi:MAG: YabP/YqfC family sporulation protein [Alicyclobacillaceae bacterium]|nr:YabP/YqfC family sporulation protein [Alicyclobacillaceae bacterium]
MRALARIWKTWATEALRLPEDVVWNRPRLEWVPGGLLRLDNHGRIVSFRDDELVIEFGDARLKVSGAGLVLVRLSPDDCVVKGDIAHLSYRPGRGSGR